MKLRYRIKYQDFGRYGRKNIPNKLLRNLLPLLLIVALILGYSCCSGCSNSFEWLLPWDPAVTNKALCQLSKSVSNGERLSHALDTFCQTIMATR